MKREQRLDAVLAATGALAEHPDPGALGDGLSPPMAAACLRWACGAIHRSALEVATDVPGAPPPVAGVVAARGVFTAPLEWVALLAAAGSEVILKAPSTAPAFCEAVAHTFTAHGLEVRCTTARELPPVDALVAMGGDEAIAALARRHARARLSLHGHRFSLAVVRGDSVDLARSLAHDALLYDGRGCFTPAAVLHLGGPSAARALVDALQAQLVEVTRRYPPGPRDPMLGPEWRRRTGLLRALGEHVPHAPPAAALVPLARIEAAALPGYLPVHALDGLEALGPLLAPWRPWLAACATDLDDAGPMLAAGFERVCRPGTLQTPPLLRPHGGRAMLRPLMFEPSVELNQAIW